MRTTILAGGLAAAGLLTGGCEPAKPTAPTPATRTAEARARDAGAAVGRAADQVGDAAVKAAGTAGDAAKENVVKPVEEMYPKVEDRLKGLTGDAAATAKDKYARVKTLVAEFRAASADGLAAAKDKLLAAVEELKKAVGL